MLIYGWKTVEQKKSPELGEPCVKCGKHETSIALIPSYFHIFWIPVFPYRRKMEICCKSCNYLAQPSELKDISLQRAKQLKRSTMPPLYTFSGSILILLLIIYFNVQGNQQAKMELEYINNPEVGDVYLYKNPEDLLGYPYSFMKVANIEGDSVYLNTNSYSYDSYVWAFDDEDAFINLASGFHKQELVRMYTDSEIKSIDRDWPESTGFGREKEYDINELLEGLKSEDEN